MENTTFLFKYCIIVNKAKKSYMHSVQSGFPNFWPVNFAT